MNAPRLAPSRDYRPDDGAGAGWRQVAAQFGLITWVGWLIKMLTLNSAEALMKANMHLILTMLALFVCVNLAAAQGTAFTYQGHLQNNGSSANGTYNFKFALFTTNASGTATAGPITNNGVSVSNGLFTTLIDFESNAFVGTTNWLEIGVATNGVSTFTVLAPRQQLTPVPYAICAANSSPTGVFSGTGSPVGVVTPAASTAIYFDDTIPYQPNIWYWANSTWTEFLGH